MRQCQRRPSTETLSFQSTHPMRGATPQRESYTDYQAISIHAPHAGCDPLFRKKHGLFSDFNPRTPCGVRQHAFAIRHMDSIFQSTHPMRGATNTLTRYINRNLISIHAPHAGCDAMSKRALIEREEFQSTHPMRGATPAPNTVDRLACISIHAPHAGCDRQQLE